MKIKKFTLALCLFMLPGIMVEAQDSKNMVVGLYSFNYLRGVRQVYPTIIAGHIAEKLSCFNDITVLNESAFPTLGKAIEDSKEAESALAETVEQGRRKNANKLVIGFISSVEEIYDYSSRSLQVSIILDIGIIDVETGQQEQSKQFLFQGKNITGVYVKYGLKKAGIDPRMVTVDDVLAITGEKGLVKAIEKSLADLDKDLFPFLAKYFGEYDVQCVSQKGSGGGKANLPPVSFGNKKDKDEVFDIVNKNTKTSLLIASNGNKKWSKRTSFDILTEVTEVDLKGDSFIREVMIGTAKFKAYSGDYAVIEISKNSGTSADEIVQSIKSGENIYVMYHQKNRAEN